MFCVLGCIGDLVNAARREPVAAAAYARTEAIVGADFKHGLSMREIIRRAAELEEQEGPAARPPAGTAMARYVGKATTARYLDRLSMLRKQYDLAA
ncbi:hypothetical protein ACFY1J_05560 [Streptomyces sp. NPDC001406]|uniref:hypothetical protein n=1 Tax=Streptomyces sp. NPDC001406 TaxID=3364572 RepID=UPI00367534EE